jgi:hypothetical protein
VLTSTCPPGLTVRAKPMNWMKTISAMALATDLFRPGGQFLFFEHGLVHRAVVIFIVRRIIDSRVDLGTFSPAVQIGARQHTKWFVSAPAVDCEILIQR